MTHIYRRRFAVRNYEMGPASHAHDSIFLNYVQQAAFEASADAGFDFQRYHELGALWVIRRQTIAYLAPLTQGDTVEVTTWVSDIRRVRSHREYELRRVSDGRLVAVARVDWVYVDAQAFFPRRVPPAVQDALQPNGVSALDSAPPLEPAKEVDGRLCIYRHRVKSYEMDRLRHVNNANYLKWLNQARLDALGEMGIGYGSPRSEAEGDWVLEPSPVRYEIEYFVPTVAGDQVEVHSRVVAAGESQLSWEHEVWRGEERAVKASATICLAGEGGAPAPLTRALLEALAR